MKSLHANPLSSTTLWPIHRLNRACSAVVTLLALGCTSNISQAQTVYKSVGPDGKVTFSDRPPQEVPAAVVGKPKAGGTGSSDAASSGSANPTLPYELKQVTAKYPVTLYTTSNCGPCDAGRAVLAKRGVPFTEKCIVTNEDIGAFSRITKDNTLPYLTIGGQQIKGFTEVDMIPDRKVEAARRPPALELDVLGLRPSDRHAVLRQIREHGEKGVDGRRQRISPWRPPRPRSCAPRRPGRRG